MLEQLLEQSIRGDLVGVLFGVLMFYFAHVTVRENTKATNTLILLIKSKLK